MPDREPFAFGKLCKCRLFCGDVPEEDDPYGVCKGLRRAPEPPLVVIVLVHRDTGEVIR